MPDAPAADDDAGRGPADAADAADATDADPEAFPVTPLVHVTDVGAAFSIEAHEVTVGQYNLFLVRFPAPSSFPPDKCSSKTALGPPSGHCGTRFANDDAISCVDWCDADAYCKAIGRHLCGDVQTHGALAANNQDTAFDEWYSACRGPGGFAYPYGQASMDVCVTDRSKGPLEVESMTGCTGAEKGIFDMAGNVAEWVDSCSSGTCIIRGGSFKFKASDATCAHGNAVAMAANTYDDVGFRCCTEP